MTALEFERRVATFINDNRLLSNGCNVIVALSGGADSVALLAVLTSLGYKCTAAHCNFHLRGAESDRDCAFARQTAQDLGANYRETHFDVDSYRHENGLSVEMACRDLRYEWFSTLASELGHDTPAPVAVAHHSDDNAETLMLNLLRGTGVAGLRGMLPLTKRGIIRPFLCVSRQQIIDYLAERQIGFITDSSNLENDVLRNRLRNIILPSIYANFPTAKQGIASTLSNMAETEKLLSDYIAYAQKRYVDAYSADSVAIDLQGIASESSAPVTLLYELIKSYGFNPTQCADILNSRTVNGHRFHSPTRMATVAAGRLIVYLPPKEAAHLVEVTNVLTDELPKGFSARLVPTADIRFSRRADRVYLDSRLATGNSFIFRHWVHSDRMQPFGMKGTKLVSDIFSNAHVDIYRKSQAWIVECAGNIIWIPGLRTSAHFPVNTSDEYALELTAARENCV